MLHIPSATRAVAATLWLLATATPLAQLPGAADAPRLTRAEIEAFLLEGRVIKRRPTGKGVTNSLRVTLTDGRLTHDAHVQSIEVSRSQFKTTSGTELNFRDTYRSNIAAYLLDKLLGLDMIPVSVERTFDRRDAAFTWWVDDVLVDEGERLKKKLMPPDASLHGMQVHRMRVIDQLIDNSDRNVGNMLWDKSWKLWLIDHSRAFGLRRDLRAPQALQRCDRALLGKLRRLDEPTLVGALGPGMTRWQITAILARRDAIVALFEELIARRGEAAVLYGASSEQ